MSPLESSRWLHHPSRRDVHESGRPLDAKHAVEVGLRDEGHDQLPPLEPDLAGRRFALLGALFVAELDKHFPEISLSVSIGITRKQELMNTVSSPLRYR